MARTEKRLVGPAAVATGPTTVYTTPAATRTKVRWIWVNNPSGSAVTFSLSVGADGATTRIFDAITIAAKAAGVVSFIEKYPDLTLVATEIITVSAGTNNILVLIINGYEDVL